MVQSLSPHVADRFQNWMVPLAPTPKVEAGALAARDGAAPKVIVAGITSNASNARFVIESLGFVPIVLSRSLLVPLHKSAVDEKTPHLVRCAAEKGPRTSRTPPHGGDHSNASENLFPAKASYASGRRQGTPFPTTQLKTTVLSVSTLTGQQCRHTATPLTV